MDDRPTSLRRVHAPGKPADGRTARGAASRRVIGSLAAILASAVASGCSHLDARRAISFDELTQAPAAQHLFLGRAYVRDIEQLRRMSVPLGPWLGLVQIRSAEEWQRLQATVGELPPKPDFQTGSVVGLICWAGTPLAGGWPTRLEAIHLNEGAGLLKAGYDAGVFYPDGSAVLEVVYVPGLAEVLVVDFDGVLYYPCRHSEL